MIPCKLHRIPRSLQNNWFRLVQEEKLQQPFVAHAGGVLVLALRARLPPTHHGREAARLPGCHRFPSMVSDFPPDWHVPDVDVAW